MPSKKAKPEAKSKESSTQRKKPQPKPKKPREIGGYENKPEPVQGEEWVINGRVSDF